MLFDFFRRKRRRAQLAAVLALPPTAPAVFDDLAGELAANPRAVAQLVDHLREMPDHDAVFDARGFEHVDMSQHARDREAALQALDGPTIADNLRRWAERGASVPVGELLSAAVTGSALNVRRARGVRAMQAWLTRYGLPSDEIAASLAVDFLVPDMTLARAASRARISRDEALRRLATLSQSPQSYDQRAIDRDATIDALTGPEEGCHG